MAWHCYEIVFRLRSPAHIGWGKVGNLQRTRPYITGRSFWGALTMRLTRDSVGADTPAIDSHIYQRIGEDVHQTLAYTYFYPATASDDSYQIAWPWENCSRFRYRFLSSYNSTALAYPQQSAATSMLHEVEFIAPHTIDTGEPIFFVGYVFAADSCLLPWRAACQRLQIGGERGYGWGDLALIRCRPTDFPLLLDQVCFDGSNERPILQLKDGQALLAHTIAANAKASGTVEPLVGREWQQYPGQHVAHAGICLEPGSKVQSDTHFVVGRFGLWE